MLLPTSSGPRWQFRDFRQALLTTTPDQPNINSTGELPQVPDGELWLIDRLCARVNGDLNAVSYMLFLDQVDLRNTLHSSGPTPYGVWTLDNSAPIQLHPGQKLVLRANGHYANNKAYAQIHLRIMEQIR